MASAIDATKPVAGSPTTQSVRDQFATAASEITALQAAAVATPVSVANGGTNATTAPTALANLGGAPLASPALTGSPTVNGAAFAAGHLPGTQTNDAAAAGQVGEYLQTGFGNTPLVSGTAFSIGSIVLTAGDWDVWATAPVTPTGATMTAIQFGLSLTSGSLASAVPGMVLIETTLSGAQIINTAPARFSVAATTTVFAVLQSNFSGGTVAANATTMARRAR